MIVVDDDDEEEDAIIHLQSNKVSYVRKTELLNNHDIENYDNLIVAAKKTEVLEDGFQPLKHACVLVCATY